MSALHITYLAFERLISSIHTLETGQISTAQYIIVRCDGNATRTLANYSNQSASRKFMPSPNVWLIGHTASIYRRLPPENFLPGAI